MQKMRDYADSLQVVALGNIPDAGRKLGIDPKVWVAARQRWQRTGLGVVCADPMSGAQPDFPAGTVCQAIDRCLTCPKKLVLADPDSIADMMLWRRALHAAEREWEDSRPDRWVSVWIPWQVFFQVVLDEKMTRGELAAIKGQAARVVEQRMQAKEIELPTPW
ncbi:MAG: hypothetical protein OXC69_09075 [Candidatus Tectomicrobia bacterium]|nr:hypothetical protein [Candidatus Tectomicrobia bacterium]